MSDLDERYQHDPAEGMAVLQELPNGGTVRYYFELTDGRAVVSKVVFERTRGVGTRMLRQSPADALEWFLREADEWQRTWLHVLARADADAGRAYDNPSNELRRAVQARTNPWSRAVERYMRRRPPREDRLTRLAVTASNYVDAVNARTRKPIEAVRLLQGRSANSVRDDVKRARSLKLLGKAPMRGVPGGSLTPEADEILARLSSATGQQRGRDRTAPAADRRGRSSPTR